VCVWPRLPCSGTPSATPCRIHSVRPVEVRDRRGAVRRIDFRCPHGHRPPDCRGRVLRCADIDTLIGYRAGADGSGCASGGVLARVPVHRVYGPSPWALPRSGGHQGSDHPGKRRRGDGDGQSAVLQYAPENSSDTRIMSGYTATFRSHPHHQDRHGAVHADVSVHTSTTVHEYFHLSSNHSQGYSANVSWLPSAHPTFTSCPAESPEG
jgi:hypothetical protein